MKTTTLLTIAMITGLGIGANAATLLDWNTSGLTGSTSGALSSTTSATNMESGVLSRGGGLTAASLTAGYSSSSWSVSFAEALSGNDFYQITVSPKTGFEMSLSGLSLGFRNTSSGVRSMQWYYSLDGFSTAGVALGSVFSLPGATTTSTYGPVSLIGVSALQNLTQTVTFRLYGWNDTGNLATGGTGAIYTTGGTSLAVVGEVVSIPEPASMVLLGLGTAIILSRRKRQA